jgi:2OG-Fe(II) oxygenase superfamily
LPDRQASAYPLFPNAEDIIMEQSAILELAPDATQLASLFDVGRVIPSEKIAQNINVWRERYATNTPYPHIALENFFDPDLIKVLVANFPSPKLSDWKITHDATGHFEEKFNLSSYESIPSPLRLFIDILNSRPFVEFLEDLTGIDGLIPDPHLIGGGLHMLARGGRLGLHIDFNRHKKMRLDRRLNALLYLNLQWKREWGGSLELWNEDVSRKCREYMPLANTLVVFSTTEKAYHGHPDPLTCPADVYRKSVALYYYTNGRPAEESAAVHTTMFKLRPGEKRTFSLKYVLKRLTPPLIWDALARIP